MVLEGASWSYTMDGGISAYDEVGQDISPGERSWVGRTAYMLPLQPAQRPTRVPVTLGSRYPR